MMKHKHARCTEGMLALHRALATEYALRYCASHGLNNDMATMPFPTLIIALYEGRLNVETTGRTERYLK